MKRQLRFGIVALGAVLALLGGINVASGSGLQGVPDPAGPPDPPPLPVSAEALPPARAELLFVPIDPCRIIDTREGGGALVGDVVRSFFITGTTGFVPQGGKSGGCGIPAGAKSITFSITSTNTVRDGRVVTFPTGSTTPNSTTLTYHSGEKDTSSGTVKLGTNGKMSVRNFGATTDLVVDVAGYYVEQIEGMVAPSGSIYSGTSRIVSAVKNSAGNFTVTVDTDVTYCSTTVTGYAGNVYASAYAFNGNKVQVYTWYLSSTGAQIASDFYFYLKVAC